MGNTFAFDHSWSRPRRKYHNETAIVEGQAFDSRREARRFQELRLLERGGEIADLQRQPEFPIHSPILSHAGEVIGLVVVAKYIADFQYRDLRRAGAVVIEDAKGVRTPLYRLKKRLVVAQYGIDIREV